MIMTVAKSKRAKLRLYTEEAPKPAPQPTEAIASLPAVLRDFGRATEPAPQGEEHDTAHRPLAQLDARGGAVAPPAQLEVERHGDTVLVSLGSGDHGAQSLSFSVSSRASESSVSTAFFWPYFSALQMAM